MAANDLYPFSTQDGKAVPLEIVKPLSLVTWTTVANTPKAIVIPAGAAAWVYSTKDIVLSFEDTALPAALVQGIVYPNAIFIPALTPMVIELIAGPAYLLSVEVATFYLNVITQYAALAQVRQTTIG